MSLSDLTLAEVERLLEEHRFYYEAYTYGGNSYPERWYSIADGYGGGYGGWGEYENLGLAQTDDNNGRWKKGEDMYENVRGLGKVYLQKQHGGEGQGDEYYIVLRVEDGETTRWFMKPGYYTSYDDRTLDGDLYEVSPQQRIVTVYENL